MPRHRVTRRLVSWRTASRRPEDGLEKVATTDQPTSTESPANLGDFGANEWLVEDMYERYLADPNSVDAAWHDFFADYRPGGRALVNGRPAADVEETQAADVEETQAAPAATTQDRP